MSHPHRRALRRDSLLPSPEVPGRTTLFWNTVEKVRDYRIPPLGHRDEEIPLPAGLALVGPHTVEAALRYRSVSPAGLAEAGVPPGAIPVPILTIHRIDRTLAL